MVIGRTQNGEFSIRFSQLVSFFVVRSTGGEIRLSFRAVPSCRLFSRTDANRFTMWSTSTPAWYLSPSVRAYLRTQCSCHRFCGWRGYFLAEMSSFSSSTRGQRDSGAATTEFTFRRNEGDKWPTPAIYDRRNTNGIREHEYRTCFTKTIFSVRTRRLTCFIQKTHAHGSLSCRKLFRSGSGTGYVNECVNCLWCRKHY